MRTNRRLFIGLLASSALATASAPAFSAARTRSKPNFIVILCDDLGYGDIEPTGGKSVPTPHLNRMAREGTVLTDYYAPANVCTPSRAGLLTGRYPIRTGLGIGVILQGDKRMLPLSEVTIPQALKPAGYVSGLFGKWHLGHLGQDWQPTKHGFDYFFGIPYSHDMLPLTLITDGSPDKEPTHEPPVMEELQQRFYSEAERFIEAHRDNPFFVELALSAPHLANYPNAKHRDPKMQSAYLEVVEEIDAIVGSLLMKLIFTSDNGPWYEGSAGGLRDRKGGAGYDGGYRVPCLVWQPGSVPAGRRSNSIAMGIDFLPTFCAMAGAPLPSANIIDGADITEVLTRGAASPHEALFLFNDEDVVAVRTQRWKYLGTSYYHGYLTPMEGRGWPQLYDMSHDIGESYSSAQRYPDVAAQMQTMLADARKRFAPLKSATQPNVFNSLIPPPAAPTPPRKQD
jgi:arylsulfatase A